MIAKANSKKLTPAYVKYEGMQAMRNTTKTYYVKSGATFASFWGS
jgi:hypothetical protein